MGVRLQNIYFDLKGFSQSNLFDLDHTSSIYYFKTGNIYLLGHYWIGNWYEGVIMFNAKSLLKPKQLRIFVYIMLGTILAIFILEFSLNMWIRASLRKGLSRDLSSTTKIMTAISWLSLDDFFHGRVRWVKINAQNCRVGDLRYAGLQIDNRGFVCNLSKLLRRKELEFISLNQTTVAATIGETALQDYFNLFYPGTGLTLKILPEKWRLSATTEIFGNRVLAQLDGKIAIASEKSLRFYPERLIIAGRVVPRDFLKFIGNQIPLEFSIMERWPLRITGIRLGEGVVFIKFREVR